MKRTVVAVTENGETGRTVKQAEPKEGSRSGAGDARWIQAGQERYAHGAENVTPASAPVSRRVAPCAIFGEGVAVVTTGREIRLVGAIWAEVWDRARTA